MNRPSINTVVKPIMTIREARKILGKPSRDVSDKEVLKMLRDYEALARYAICEYLLTEPKEVL